MEGNARKGDVSYGQHELGSRSHLQVGNLQNQECAFNSIGLASCPGLDIMYF